MNRARETQPRFDTGVLSQILEESNHRGIVAQGERIGNRTRRVEFKADPTPLMTITIVYYHP